MVNFYKSTKFFNSFHLNVDKINKIYVREYGNKNGIPIFYIHGGPGGFVKGNKITKYFNLKKYYLIVIDQRGCGKSEPLYSIKNNNTKNLVKDIKKVKDYLEIDKFIITGFSWGALLSLIYCLSYPNDIISYILGAGLYLFENSIWPKTIFNVYPEKWKKFCEDINIPKKLIQNPSLKTQKEICKKYFNKIKNNKINNKFSKIWFDFEENTVSSCDKKKRNKKYSNKEIYEISFYESLYYYRKFYITNNFILKNLHKIKNIKGFIIHGRFDVICSVEEAINLHNILPKSKLIIIENEGHHGKKIDETFLKILRQFYKN
jgi:proline iminopeptidase